MHTEKDHIPPVLGLRVPNTYYSSTMIHTLEVTDPEKNHFPFIHFCILY